MKKKILALCLVVVLVATAITGVTLAYFTDVEIVKNTFTTGNIDLKLDEAEVKVDENDDYIEDTDAERTEEGIDDYDLHPGQNVWKDPKMTLTTSTDDNAYLAAKVVITADLSELYVEDGNYVNFKDFVYGGVTYTDDYKMSVTDTAKFDSDVNMAWEVEAGGEKYYLTQQIVSHVEEEEVTVVDPETKEETTETVETFVIDSVTMCYYFKDEQVDEDTITLFTNLKIDEDWDNAEMAKLNGMTIDVTGYAVQVDGFTDVLEAMSNAFGAELSVIAA